MTKVKKRKAATASHPSRAKPGVFPLAQYTSVVGVHCMLLTFTALFLPRTPSILSNVERVSTNSRDRPQHPFLEPMTRDPLSTLLCICVGTAILQAWWAGWVRGWYLGLSSSGSDNRKRSEMKRRKVIVRSVHSRPRCVFLLITAWQDLGNAWIATIVAAFLGHVTLILFGAPIIRCFHTLSHISPVEPSHVSQSWISYIILGIVGISFDSLHSSICSGPPCI